MPIGNTVRNIGEAVAVQGDNANSVRAPWIERPFELISWWDMEQFSAERFYQIGAFLQSLTRFLEDVEKGDYSNLSARKRAERIAVPVVTVKNVREECEKVGLRVSTRSAENIEQQFVDFVNGVPRADIRNIRQSLEELSSIIMWEMQEHTFMRIPAERAAKYKQRALLGEDVHGAFESARFDVEEAGNCFAAARYTACVMHLNRVVESGLKALVADMSDVKLKHDWGAQIGEIEKALERRYRAAGARTPDEEFYSEAAAQIGHIKNAWRNPTMHIERKYNEDEAKDIMNAVGAFMRHLSKRLHDKPEAEV